MKYLPALIVLLSVLLYPNHADANTFDSFHKGQREYSIGFGYGKNYDWPDATKDLFTFTSLRGRYGIFTSERSQTSFAFTIDDIHSSTANFLFTGTTGYRRYFLAQNNIALAYDLDIGLAYFSDKITSQGTQINFTEQIGILAAYFTSDNTALTLEFKFSHISNANIKEPNVGINASEISLGYSWYR